MWPTELTCLAAEGSVDEGAPSLELHRFGNRAAMKPRRRQPLNLGCRAPRPRHWIRILEAEAWVQPRCPKSESPDPRAVPMAWVRTMKRIQSGRSLKASALPTCALACCLLLVGFLPSPGTPQRACPLFAERPGPIRGQRRIGWRFSAGGVSGSGICTEASAICSQGMGEETPCGVSEGISLIVNALYRELIRGGI